VKNNTIAVPWKVSLHGGHSYPFCDHAKNHLEEILDAAVDQGYRIFGVTEHAPRMESKYLYDEEVEMGWTVDTLNALFSAYARTLDMFQKQYANRLEVLKGFEIEVCPPGRYKEIMLSYQQQLNFDYIVGSVHYIDDLIFDYKPEYVQQILKRYGSYENIALRYYETLAEMVPQLHPDVIGHFDLIRCIFPQSENPHSPRIIEAASHALEVIRSYDCILDVNTSGIRKALGGPYPSSTLLGLAQDMGIPFCFGDDSHAVAHVGAGIEEARLFLLKAGVDTITCLSREKEELIRLQIPLCD
jgi:histidinol-phosphatase (PHP family)